MSRRRGRPPGSIQGNAADPAAIRAAGRLEDEDERTENQDMTLVLSSAAGRRVLWRILKECKMLEAIWDPSVRMHFYAGRQDVGFGVVAMITRAQPSAWLDMQREHLEAAQRRERTVDAHEIAAQEDLETG